MPWYAIYCRAQHERTVLDGLVELGIEGYLPTIGAGGRGPGAGGARGRAAGARCPKPDKPLFPGYVFAHCQESGIRTAAGVRGAVHVLAAAGQPLEIPDQEIEGVRALLRAGVPVETESYHEYKQGEKVEIAYGPFVGWRGVVVRRKKGTRLIVAISALEVARSVELEAGCLRLTGKPGGQEAGSRAVGCAA